MTRSFPPAVNDKIKWLLAAALLLGGWIAGFMMGGDAAPSVPALPAANLAATSPATSAAAAANRLESLAPLPAADAAREESASASGASSDALLILVCTYVGAIYGGSRSAILLNIPGTPASAASCLAAWLSR